MNIVEMRVTLEQEEDSGGRSNADHQYLDIEITDAGGGPYFVMKTERWAFDDLAPLMAKCTEMMDLYMKGREAHP
jgi:hypothetical protein